MRNRDLEALEFDKLLMLLAKGALSDSGKEACLALKPDFVESAVQENSVCTWECFRLLEEHPGLPIEAFADVRIIIEKVLRRESVLDGSALRDLLEVGRSARMMAQFLRKYASHYGQLSKFVTSLPILSQLEESLSRCLTPAGEIKDNASEKLQSARKSMKGLKGEIQQRLESTLRSEDLKDVVSDQFVTVRNDRFVIPVRPNFRGRMEGVVQDRSGTGGTLFIEPLFAVELNNRLLLAGKDVRAEEQRILLFLTALVRENLDPLKKAFATLTTIDVLHAKVVFARMYGKTRPQFGSNISLKSLKHPLLVAQRKEVVPIDLILPRDKRGLVITGPNAGGKTAAMKTMGLVSLMAQTGFLIPCAEDNELPIFGSVMVDIGDAQSLEKNLSTFSAHVVNVKEIVSQFREPALVLLDEPGGGTDPAESAALAKALLFFLKAGEVSVFASTHLMDIKIFALEDNDYRIASVSFDADTLQPNYKLNYESPGQSLGLASARRLGLHKSICDYAENSMSSGTQMLSRALTGLEERAAALLKEQKKSQEERAALVSTRKRLEETTAKENAQLRDAWQREIQEAKALIKQVQEEGRKEVERLRSLEGAHVDSFRRVAKQVTNFGRNERSKLRQKEERFGPKPRGRVLPLVLGADVKLLDTNIRGKLEEIRGGRARIRRGGITFEVSKDDVRPLGTNQQGTKWPEVQVMNKPQGLGVRDINLLGCRVAQALPRLEAFLDQAVLSNHKTIRVLHGVGSGVLRKAIREYLSHSAYCDGFHEAPVAEGGSGTTIVDLAV